MNRLFLNGLLCASIIFAGHLDALAQQRVPEAAHDAVLVLRSNHLRAGDQSGSSALKLDNFFYETDKGRVMLPAELTSARTKQGGRSSVKMPDGRRVALSVRSGKLGEFNVRLNAEPAGDIKKWGLAFDAGADEYFTGLMERVVDGPQQASWAPGIKEAMNLRGQSVEMIVKPTTSIYSPFFLSSRGYAVFVEGTWPGLFDFWRV